LIMMYPDEQYDIGCINKYISDDSSINISIYNMKDISDDSSINLV
jgi:hypothetical protein